MCSLADLRISLDPATLTYIKGPEGLRVYFVTLDISVPNDPLPVG
jgi:hypothetical protein